MCVQLSTKFSELSRYNQIKCSEWKISEKYYSKLALRRPLFLRTNVFLGKIVYRANLKISYRLLYICIHKQTYIIYSESIGDNYETLSTTLEMCTCIL